MGTLSLLVLLLLVLFLPPFGALISGHSFPKLFPIFLLPQEPGISSVTWPAWGIVAFLITVTLLPFLLRFSQKTFATNHSPTRAQLFPWWGWLAILWTSASWVLAWTRFTWFSSFQSYTFPLLWFGYIVTMNALSYQRSGRCLIMNRPRFIVSLFLLSTGYWWTYEYLNQYVKNWHYANLSETSQLEYFFMTSLSFSTVLPAVISTYEWLWCFPRLTKPFNLWKPVPWLLQQSTGWILLGVGSIGLTLIGIWPTALFPLLWVSPLCLLLGLAIIQKEKILYSNLAHGDWRPVILSALAAFMCGVWWELWNVRSLVHWEYTIPFVQAFKIFEMPILGYAGYLPFGVLCLTITGAWLGYRMNHPLREASRTTRDNTR